MPSDADMAVLTAIARRAADTVTSPMTPEERTGVIFMVLRRLIEAGAWVRNGEVFMPTDKNGA